VSEKLLSFFLFWKITRKTFLFHYRCWLKRRRRKSASNGKFSSPLSFSLSSSFSHSKALTIVAEAQQNDDGDDEEEDDEV